MEEDKIRRGYIIDAFAGPQAGGIATQPLRYRGSPIEGDKMTSGCITPAFSGPNVCGIAT